MDIPDSMKEELQAWNGGNGIDLESWVGCEGRFSLAVGYITLFWPEFEEVGDYIVRKGYTTKYLSSLESQQGASRLSIERLVNHLHIVDTHAGDSSDLTKDKVVILGKCLKEIYEAKLAWQFPDKRCVVEFYIPENEDALDQYQILFWQKRHESFTKNCD